MRQAVDGVLRQLGGDGKPVVCVDMGSTPRMGLLPSPARFVVVLARAMDAAGCGGLVLAGGYGPLMGVHRFTDPPHQMMKHCHVVILVRGIFKSAWCGAASTMMCRGERRDTLCGIMSMHLAVWK